MWDHVQVGDKQLEWQPAVLEDYTLDLHRLLNRSTASGLTYAVCYVQVPAEAQGLKLRSACSDPAKLHLNGRDIVRALRPANYYDNDILEDAARHARRGPHQQIDRGGLKDLRAIDADGFRGPGQPARPRWFRGRNGLEASRPRPHPTLRRLARYVSKERSFWNVPGLSKGVHVGGIRDQVIKRESRPIVRGV